MKTGLAHSWAVFNENQSLLVSYSGLSPKPQSRDYKRPRTRMAAIIIIIMVSNHFLTIEKGFSVNYGAALVNY